MDIDRLVRAAGLAHCTIHMDRLGREPVVMINYGNMNAAIAVAGTIQQAVDKVVVLYAAWLKESPIRPHQDALRVLAGDDV